MCYAFFSTRYLPRLLDVQPGRLQWTIHKLRSATAFDHYSVRYDGRGRSFNYQHGDCGSSCDVRSAYAHSRVAHNLCRDIHHRRWCDRYTRSIAGYSRIDYGSVHGARRAADHANSRAP